MVFDQERDLASITASIAADTLNVNSRPILHVEKSTLKVVSDSDDKNIAHLIPDHSRFLAVSHMRSISNTNHQCSIMLLTWKFEGSSFLFHFS